MDDVDQPRGEAGHGALELARAVLDAQPFSVLLGATISEFADGHARLSVPLRGELRQQNGYAHGGVLSYLADNALTFAAGSIVGPEVLTAEMKISYLDGARGASVEARASVLHVGNRLVTVRCEVFDHRDDEHVLCATALGTVATRSSG